jgi:hypothetical protein
MNQRSVGLYEDMLADVKFSSVVVSSVTEEPVSVKPEVKESLEVEKEAQVFKIIVDKGVTLSISVEGVNNNNNNNIKEEIRGIFSSISSSLSSSLSGVGRGGDGIMYGGGTNSVVGFRASLPKDLQGAQTTAEDILGPEESFCVPHLKLRDEVLQLLKVAGMDVADVQECVSSSGIGPAALVSGTLSGVNVVILLDSGAQTNLVSRSFVESNRHVSMTNSSVRLRFGDNNESNSLGQLNNLTLKVQDDVLKIPVIHVSPHTMVGVDLILGTPFWQQTGGGLFINPLPCFVFPSGKKWHAIADRGLGTINSEADICLLQGVHTMKQYLNVNKGCLDKYVINLKSVNVSNEELQKHTGRGSVHPQVEALLKEFSDVAVSSLPRAIERQEGVDIDEAFLKIPLKEGATPKAHRPFPMSQGEMLVLQQMLTELLEKNYIEPTTNSSGWSAPIFLLRKPGTREGVLQQFRLIVDFRSLNASLKVEAI